MITIAGPVFVLIALASYLAASQVLGSRGAGDPVSIMLIVCIGFFAVIGVWAAVMIPSVWRRRGYLIGSDGFRVLRGRKSFDFAWGEIDAVAVSFVMSQGDPTSGLPKSVRDHKVVRLDFWPSMANFSAAHPATKSLWNSLGATGHFRMGLDPRGGIIPELDAALAEFAGGRYRGITDDGYKNPANPA